MMHVRSARDRHHDRRGGLDAWLTFYPRPSQDPLSDGFGSLQAFDEYSLPPGASVQLGATFDAEVFTYVREGALVFEDPAGGSGVLTAGEFQRTTSRGAIRRAETNASPTEWAHFFRICLRTPETEREAGTEQKRFTSAECRGRLRVVASPDGRRGSLRIQPNVVICAALLDGGQHLVHELFQGRRAWLQILHGSVTLGETHLAAGDGAGITAERAVAFTAREETSLLLLDIGEPQPRLAGRSGAAVFGLLWDGLSDVLGSAAAATVVGRAARRATPRSPELGELAISRVERQYRYVVPRSFERAAGMSGALGDLLGELKPLLVELTGRVALGRLEGVPELREWASRSPQPLS